MGENINNKMVLMLEKSNKFYKDPLLNLKADFRTVLKRKFLKAYVRLYPLSINLRQRFIIFLLTFFGF